MSAPAGLPVASGRVVAREAWRALGGRHGRLVVLAAVFVGAAAAGTVPPLALGLIVDALVAPAADPSAVWLAGAAMAASVVAGAILSAVGLVASSRLLETMLARLRESMVAAALRLPQADVERAGTGDLISRAGDDVAEVAEAIPGVVPALTGSLFTIVLTFVGLAAIDPRYALALLVIVPVHVYAVRRYLRDAPQLYARERAAMAERAQQLLDALRGLESVRAYDLSHHHLGRIGMASWAVVRWSMHARTVQNAFFARLNLAEFLGMGSLLVVGFLLVQSGAGTVGGVTAAMLLFLRLFGPINELLFVIDELQSALASLSRIVGVIVAGERVDAATPADRAPEDAGIHLRAIHHSYTDGHPSLTAVDLDVAAGSMVAVVGESGAGKSTLAALAAGVHTPSAGSVEAPRDVVLVTQEVHVFAATLRANLALVRPDAEDDEFIAALCAVEAEALVDRLDDGLDTVLHADSVSAAEAQQIALARVVLADPRAVILDEATAEAGSSDADRIERAAMAAIEGRTALVVAHRLSQAVVADRVVVLDRGRVEEHGTHDELLATGGSYARLWSAWCRPRED